MQTNFQLPTFIFPNPIPNIDWFDPQNILLQDGLFASSTGSTQMLTVGFLGNIAIPQGSNITNITVKVRGYRGAFNTTLNLYYVDNTTGIELAYPLAPFQGFSGTNTTYTLPSSLGGTTWTVDQINNLKLRLISNGELHIDDVQVSIDYVAQVTPVPVAPSTGQVVVDEFVQSIRFQLASSITDTELFAFTQSFTLPDGTPIQYADFHGTEAFITMDQGVPGLEENIRITAIDHNYQGTGLTRLSFGNITNRGLKFIYPYDHDINLCKPHDGTAEFVISNSAPFYDRFLRKNQINALVSAPIYVQDESVQLTDPVHTLDFQGAGVTVANDGGDSFKKIVTIAGNGVNPPFVSSTSSATSGASQVSSLTWSHVSSGLNRTLLVQVDTEAAQTITGITYNGVALTQAVTNNSGTLRNEQWYLIAPAVGTYNIVVTLSGAAYVTCGAETINTTDQTSPIGVTQTSNGTSVSPSLILNTGTDNSLVIDSLTTGTLPIVYTAGAGQTENWKITATPNVQQGASSVEPAGVQPDAVTMSWAITQNVPWVMTALEIKGISSAVASGITSINGDTTPAQTIAAGAGINVSTVAGVTTITNTGPGGTGTALETTVSQTGHGLSVGDVIKVSGTNTFAKAQADTEVNSETVGIVTTVVNPNSFKYVSSAIQLAIAPVGTPGSAVWLSPTVAGGMTTTKPSTVGQVARALGTIIESGVTMYFDIAALAEVIGSGSGTGSFVQSGVSQKIGINITSPDPTNAFIRTMKFGNDLVLLTRGTNASGNFKVRVYSRNSDGGYTETVIADIPTAGGGAGVNAVSISKALDNSKLYVSKVGRSLGGGIQPVPMDITIDEYDSSYSLVTSYTGQTPNSLYDSDISSGFFVNGSSLYISLDNFRPATVPKHWNRWTIAGTSLTTVTDTNLIKGDDYPAFTDGTNAWFSGTNAVDHFTYSGVTFTLVGTSVLPTTTIGVNLTTASSTDAYQGVEIVSSGTKIGWFLNTSRTMLEFGSSTTLMDYMYEYNVYPF